MLRGAQLLAFCTAAALLYAQHACALESSKQITLDAGGCQGVEWNRLGEKYGYTAKLKTLTLPPGCQSSKVRVSKLYVQDACVDKRDNNFEVKLEKEHLICSKVIYPDQTTCQQVFKYGPQDALLVASTLKQNADGSWTLDQGNICYNTDHAFVYIQSNCTEPISATVTLDTVSYAGETCVVVEGHALGVAGIVGIAIAVALVLLILSSVIKCLCCCL